MKKLLSLLMLVAGTASAQLTILPLSGFPSIANMSNNDYFVILVQTGGGHYTNRNITLTNLAQLLQNNNIFLVPANVIGGTNIVVGVTNGVVTINSLAFTNNNLGGQLQGTITNGGLVDHWRATNGNLDGLNWFGFANTPATPHRFFTSNVLDYASVHIQDVGTGNGGVDLTANDDSQEFMWGRFNTNTGYFKSNWVMQINTRLKAGTSSGPQIPDGFGLSFVIANDTNLSSSEAYNIFYHDPTNRISHYFKPLFLNTNGQTVVEAGIDALTIDWTNGITSLMTMAKVATTGPGTLSQSTTNVTGVGTGWTTNLIPGTVLFTSPGGTRIDVLEITDDTHLVALESQTIGSTNYTVQLPSGVFRDNIVGDFAYWSAFLGDGSLFALRYNPGVFNIFQRLYNGSFEWDTAIGGANQWILWNPVGNKEPILVDSTAGNELQILSNKIVAVNGFQLPVNTNHAGFMLTTDANGNGSWSTNVNGIQASNGVTAQHFAGLGAATVTLTNTGAGTGGTVTLDANANDSGFTATLNTGSAPAGSGAVIFQVSFNKAYASNPHVVFSPANTTAAALSGPTNVYANAVTTLVQFNAGNTGLAASNQYIWNFLITQ